jgi:SAM-dependent methyltransferase
MESNDFRMEPELTIKLAKRRARIFEIPISYSGRTYEEGKKINWRDGFRALAAIVRFAISDKIYLDEMHGGQSRARLSRAGNFNSWMADTIRAYCGERVLEIGCGVGNLTCKLIPRRQYTASDSNPLYLETLKALSADRPYLQTSYCDVTNGSSFPQCDQLFDTAICLNVIANVDDDCRALDNIRQVLSDRGRAIVLVPQGEWIFGTLDKALGHKRRYSKRSLKAVAEASGFVVKEIFEFNRFGTLGWFINAKILRRQVFGVFQIWLLDLLTPLFRHIDRILPFPGLSLIAVLERQEAQKAEDALPAFSNDVSSTPLAC